MTAAPRSEAEPRRTDPPGAIENLGQAKGLAKGQAEGRAERKGRLARDRVILDLRLHGLTFDEIVEKLPTLGFAAIGVAQVQTIVRRALRASEEPSARDLRRLEALRLDQLQAAYYPAAMGGDPRAISRVLSIMDRRAKLLGLLGATENAETPDAAREALLRKLEILARSRGEGSDRTP